MSSLQNVLTKRSSSFTIWFQMRCWMTSCQPQLLNSDLYTFSLYENPSFIIVSAETEYISTILLSSSNIISFLQLLLLLDKKGFIVGQSHWTFARPDIFHKNMFLLFFFFNFINMISVSCIVPSCNHFYI